jgi:phage virion morphogenesis protein
MSNDGLQITIEIDGSEIEAALARLREGLKSNDLMEGIGMQVAAWSQDRITSLRNVAPDGTVWERLKPNTLKRKAARGFGHQGTLMQSGSMWYQITHQNVTADSVEVGSPSVYAMVQQQGNRAGTIPARPYLGVSEEEKTELAAYIEGWAKRLLAGD